MKMQGSALTLAYPASGRIHLRLHQIPHLHPAGRPHSEDAHGSKPAAKFGSSSTVDRGDNMASLETEAEYNPVIVTVVPNAFERRTMVSGACRVADDID
jgi:hypothetical protein